MQCMHAHAVFNLAETATAAAKLHTVGTLSVILVHHLEFGLWTILPSHGPCLPSWHSIGLSALLLGLANGLLHKGGLSSLCPGVVKALLALKVGKVGLGSWLLLLLVLARVGIAID